MTSQSCPHQGPESNTLALEGQGDSRQNGEDVAEGDEAVEELARLRVLVDGPCDDAAVPRILLELLDEARPQMQHAMDRSLPREPPRLRDGDEAQRFDALHFQERF